MPTTLSSKKQEEEWKAESDAHTLAEAEVIKGDSDRLKKAQKAAQRLADEQREKADAMEKTAHLHERLFEKSPPEPKRK